MDENGIEKWSTMYLSILYVKAMYYGNHKTYLLKKTKGPVKDDDITDP